MTWETFQCVWLVLAGLVYILFTCVLLILAAQHGRAIAIHDRIRESKNLRHQYLKAIAEKEAGQP